MRRAAAATRRRARPVRPTRAGGRCPRRLLVSGRRSERAHAAPSGLAHLAKQDVDQPDAREAQDGQCGPPAGEGGDDISHQEPEPGADDLTGEDVAVHAPAFSCRKEVSGERSDRRARHGCERAEADADREEPSECRCQCAGELHRAPQSDHPCQQSQPRKTVDQDAEGERGQRGYESGDRDEQTDVGVPDPQSGLHLGHQGRDHPDIGCGQRGHRSQHHDDPPTVSAPDRPRESVQTGTADAHHQPAERPERSEKERAHHRLITPICTSRSPASNESRVDKDRDFAFPVPSTPGSPASKSCTVRAAVGRCEPPASVAVSKYIDSGMSSMCTWSFQDHLPSGGRLPVR